MSSSNEALRDTMLAGDAAAYKAARLQQEQGLMNAAINRAQAAMDVNRAEQEARMAAAKAQSQWATDLLKVNPPLMIGKTKLKGPPMIALIDGDLIAYRSAAATPGS